MSGPPGRSPYHHHHGHHPPNNHSRSSRRSSSYGRESIGSAVGMSMSMTDRGERERDRERGGVPVVPMIPPSIDYLEGTNVTSSVNTINAAGSLSSPSIQLAPPSSMMSSFTANAGATNIHNHTTSTTAREGGRSIPTATAATSGSRGMSIGGMSTAGTINSTNHSTTTNIYDSTFTFASPLPQPPVIPPPNHNHHMINQRHSFGGVTGTTSSSSTSILGGGILLAAGADSGSVGTSTVNSSSSRRLSSLNSPAIATWRDYDYNDDNNTTTSSTITTRRRSTNAAANTNNALLRTNTTTGTNNHNYNHNHDRRSSASIARLSGIGISVKTSTARTTTTLNDFSNSSFLPDNLNTTKNDNDNNINNNNNIDDNNNHNNNINNNNNNNNNIDNYNQNDKKKIKNNNNNNNQDLTKMENHLRTLLSSCLISNQSTPSPSSAVFYGSMLYSRTQKPSDAFLYARALAANHESRRAVYILDNAGLLSTRPQHGYTGYEQHDNDDNNYNNLNVLENGNCPHHDPASTTATTTTNTTHLSTREWTQLRIESAILAARCLAKTGEWEEALLLLEEACRYPPPEQHSNHHHHDSSTPHGAFHAYPHNNNTLLADTLVESGTDPKLFDLAEFVLPYSDNHNKLNRNDNNNNDHNNDNNNIIINNNNNSNVQSQVHPVARLCSLRGIVYDELSNPTCAISFLSAALQIDPCCVEACDYLFQRHLLTQKEERDLILNLHFPEHMDWLRDFYITRLTLNSNHISQDEKENGGLEEDEVELEVEKKGEEKSKTIPKDLEKMGHMDESTFNNISRILPNQTPQINFLRNHPNDAHGTGDDNDHDHHNDAVNKNLLDVMNASSIHMDTTSSPFMDPYPHRNQHPQPHRMEKKNLSILCESKQSNNSNVTNISTSSSSNQFNAKIQQAFHNLSHTHKLSKSPEVLSLIAMRAYDAHDLPTAYIAFRALMQVDPLCSTAAHVHIATLTGLGYRRPLFRLAHELVEADPKSAMAWYAVGSYYHSCGQYDLAQKHFCRATRLDPRSAECWIAFGCAFAACDESDQALASFRAARRLHSGSHYPMLYMGMEYLRTNHLSLAGHFLSSAREMGKGDPLCCNELGVWAYRKGEWEEAIYWFQETLKLCVSSTEGGRNTLILILESEDHDGLEERVHHINLNPGRQNFSGKDDKSRLSTSKCKPKRLTSKECIEYCENKYWEPTIFNLGQSYRKSRLFSKAMLCFEKCVSLCPGNSASYSALGFTQHLVGNIQGAIESYHQALSLKTDDPLASEMLNRALYEALDDPNMTSRESTVDESTSKNKNATRLRIEQKLAMESRSISDSNDFNPLSNTTMNMSATMMQSMGLSKYYQDPQGSGVGTDKTSLQNNSTSSNPFSFQLDGDDPDMNTV